ncbi:DUF6216 family protein [Aeromonas hydrophila]|uniref:DUF6216 family protein n=1 Tax=Aeromonas hydrophila TaxID=644 RepID=UPI003986153B
MDAMISSIFNIESFISIMTITVIITLLVLFVSKRAGSSFGIINKLVNFIFSSKGFHSDKINRIWQEREDIERFNALFNTRALSVDNIISFDGWIKKYSIDLKKIAGLGGGFDIKRNKIKKSPWYVILIIGGLSLFFFSITCFSFMLTISNAALIKMNNFDDVGWFWINSERAYAAQSPFKEGVEWKITKDSCEKKSNEDIKLPREFIDSICESFFEKESLDFIAELISAQNKMLVPTVMLAAFTVYIFSEVNKVILANVAREMVLNSIIAYRRNRISKYIGKALDGDKRKVG